MSVTEFLRSLDDRGRWAGDLEALARLAGQTVGETLWLDSMRAARGHVEPWMPLWFVPIARLELGRVAGVDLRPEHRRQGVFRIMETWEPGVMLSAALNLEDHVLARLVRFQMIEQDEDASVALPQEVVAARALVGSALGIECPAREEIAAALTPDRWRWDRGDRAPEVALGIMPNTNPEDDLPFLLQALESSPDCFTLHYNIGLQYAELGDIEAGAPHIAHAMLCPRYTRNRAKPQNIRATAELFFEIHPELFSDEAIARLQADSPEGLLPLVEQARDQGRIDDAVRLAIDLCFEEGDTEGHIDALLRPLFLGEEWGWARRLCDFRQGLLD